MSTAAAMSDLVPPELTKACAEVGVAGPDDAVAGRQARFVATPASTEEAAGLLRAAAGLGLSIAPRGSGSRLGWGLPPRSCDLIVDTRRLDLVIEHAAGDLVVSVQSGVDLAALSDRLEAQGQRLALDPPGGGTVGGLIATGVAGPLRLRYGAPRDLLIGITVVRADGTAAKAGGKVVKNVAGYDLGKLFAGSYGTLGLITEATFRLHPRPPASTYVVLNCPDPETAAAAVQASASSPLAPAAIEMSWPSAAEPVRIAVLLEGDADGVAERAARLQLLLPGGQATAEPPPWWAWAGDSDQTVLRIGFWPGQLSRVLADITSAAAAAGLEPAVAGSAAAGVLHLALDGPVPAKAVNQLLTSLRAGPARVAAAATPDRCASVVVLHAPPAVRDAVDMWGPAPAANLMRAIKDQFDPEHRMAPGRFAAGL